MDKFIKFRILPLLLAIFSFIVTNGQTSLATGQEVKYNPISTAVPFLTITPDSRHGAMGDVGVATSPDANSQYLNAAKYVFAEEKQGFSISYTPWLRQLVSDINLAYLAGYSRLSNTQAIGYSLRYFSMGDITLTSADEMQIGIVRPSEFALDFSYSMKLSNNLSGGVTLRFIRSNLSGGIGAEVYDVGNAFATDVSFYYTRQWGGIGSVKSISAGANLSNIGSKISYDQGANKEFLPANLKLGTTFYNEFDNYNSLSISMDINKLLIPTPANKVSYADDGSIIILPDNTTNQTTISALFSSFTDAPGKFKEELQEYNVSTGLEYWYNKQFAVRAGYFNESINKGNRKFFTAGVGVKMNIAAIDFSYVIPLHQNNPLANTIRFTLLFDLKTFSALKKKN